MSYYSVCLNAGGKLCSLMTETMSSLKRECYKIPFAECTTMASKIGEEFKRCVNSRIDVNTCFEGAKVSLQYYNESARRDWYLKVERFLGKQQEVFNSFIVSQREFLMDPRQQKQVMVQVTGVMMLAAGLYQCNQTVKSVQEVMDLRSRGLNATPKIASTLTRLIFGATLTASGYLLVSVDLTSKGSN